MTEPRINPCAVCLEDICPEEPCEMRLAYGWEKEEQEWMERQRARVAKEGKDE